MEVKFCYCDDWRNNIEILQVFLHFGQYYGMLDKLKTFNYCPWCGEKLDTTGEENGGNTG
jgi:hypothetical protein